MDARSLPPHLVEHARAYADGSRVAAEPRAASTVVLLRNGPASPAPGGLEAYLLRRHVGMEFAAGMSVFPGGGVDARDSEFDDALWAGPSVAEWAARLECSEAEARELVCAAVRETFEESGVLLAGTVDAVVGDTTGEDWEAERVALETRQLSLTDLLTRRGLVLRTDLLAGLSGWLTPKFEPKRYRTWFFVAALPPGQVTRDVSTESDAVAWWSLRDAISAVAAGDMLMLPPTVITLAELYDAGSVDEALATARALPWEMAEPVFDLATDQLVIPERFGALAADVLARVADATAGSAADATAEATAEAGA
ncbi:NUDIX hydrolase [Nocardioides jiangxiensis]|uniref:NUDIX hydrolase n=1 Tax=Nocardioides jiangxiensis TaxID=3064524 RepID=A0ABT9B0Q1_9ACTN|nr:NUDIX hydrolase [Nocardioides sp. WY-20]MDO7868444.1 NUDIX hydrolase [Nocardioides sp. WY-20]